MSSSIKIDHVSKRFADQWIIRDLAFEVRPSEIVSLLGPSGCGKSTLLRLLSGLEREHDGRLLIDEAGVVTGKRQCALMFQEPRLMPWLSVRENVLFGVPSSKDRSRQHKEKIAHELLEQVGLGTAANLLPKQLSGGMAQRVALARSLAAAPSVLLLDEPFSAVDALTRMSLQDLLLGIWQRTQLTMLLVTHDIDEALYLSDRVVVLTGRPANISEIVSVQLPRPRDRRDPQLLRLRAHLLEELRIAETRTAAPKATKTGTPFGV